MLTRQDLVEWQFRIAAGEPLPLSQDQITMDGHAIEARVYAENPARNFLPSPGVITHLRLPKDRPGLCVDTSLASGDEITPYYDPMIAKIIAWGTDRDDALHTLRRALVETRVAGIATNLQLLSATLRHKEFIGGKYDTGFLERYRNDLIEVPESASELVLGLGALYLLLMRRKQTETTALRSVDPYSPWAVNDGWRLNLPAQDVIRLIDGDLVVDVGVTVGGIVSSYQQVFWR